MIFLRRFSKDIALFLALFVGLVPGVAMAQVVARDDFDTASWSESTGSLPWSGAWAVSGNATRSGGEALLRVDNTRITRSLNLAGYDVAQLNLRLRSASGIPANSALRIQAATAASGTFTTLHTVNGPTTSTDISLVLTPFIAAATTIRFEVVNTNGSNDFYAIDFVEVRAIAPQCFSEDFSASSLDPADWATNSVSGSFGQPRIINGRLRLTDNSIRVATAASLRRFFPGADNRVVVEFDYFGYNGSGADGIAVVLSDGSVTPVAGAFGGSLGYAQKAPPPASDCETSTGCPGFAGGWLGVGLDEFGNFSNPTEGRVGGPGSRRDAIALRGSGSGTTGYRYLAGTNTLSPGVDISGSTPGPNHRYRITVDNRTGAVAGATVSVERRTTPSGSFVSLVSPFDIFSANPGQAPVPENFRLSFTGSTGGSTNIHELDNLRVCATRINQVVEIDHFRFFHDGQGLTCGPESIVVQACLDPNCTQQVSGPIQVTLQPSGWVGGDTQTIVSGQTLQLRRTTPGNVTFAVSASNPPRRPFTPDRCFVGGVQQANCNFNFADSGFIHDVSNHVSAVEQVLKISAVRRDNTTQRCVPGFANVTRTVGFWSNYLNPTTGTRPVVVNGANIGTASPGTNLTLAFDANGEAELRVRYADVGAVRLFSRYVGSAATEDASLVMTGQDDFIAKPKDFLLSGLTGAFGSGGASDSGGARFHVAGQPFTVTVTARNNDNQPTPNFGREQVPEGVRLESVLQAPAGGINPVPVASPGFGSFSNGVASGQWRWDEVGIISLVPRLADGDYLGYGTPAQPAPGNTPDVVGSALPNVGRFIPARLAITPNTPTLMPACAAGGFGYTGQEFGFAAAPELTVRALNALGNTTQNYVDAGPGNAFWKFPGTMANRSYTSTATGTVALLSRTTNGGNATLSEQTAAPFDGTGRVTISGDRLTYARPTTPEAPFEAQITLTLPAADLTDSDGVCHDVAPFGSCDPLSIPGIAGTSQRWGRIAMTNAFGPELSDLRVPMRAEFYNGTTFVPNPNDVCSAVAIAPFVDVNAGDTLVPADTCVQDSGSPGASGRGCAAPGPGDRRFTATPGVGNPGNYVLWLRAPGAGRVGVLDVTATVPDWLRFDWRGTGPVAPTARIGFGVYQGDRRAIHEREVY
ncbi:DUF6701 domain-containing protein [Silanimonas lenta]|uniref:DUF6701 domain-containing protein n=1 Tax=Silanimonas lenta TaxID=265429 RepID=UPI0003F5D699|nr:DUF6701 domain-containing protein [Silanimonas lenta]